MSSAGTVSVGASLAQTNFLSVKLSVVALADANVTLSGEQSVDGVTTATSRVLLTGQTSSVANGIWVTNSGAWSRPTDFAVGQSAAGSFVFVELGTVYGSNGFVCTNTPGSDVIGTSGLTFTQFSGAGLITAGAGLTKTGNTIDFVAGDSTLTVGANSVTVTTPVTFTNVNATLAAADAAVTVGSQGFTAGFVTIGTAATAGSIRLPKVGTVNWLNNAGSANITGITTDASDDVLIGEATNTTALIFNCKTSGTHSFKVNGTTIQSLSSTGTNALWTSAGNYRVSVTGTVLIDASGTFTNRATQYAIQDAAGTANNMVLVTNATPGSATFGIFGIGPVGRAGAITQTYSTATRTHANVTSSAVATTAAATLSFGYTQAQADSIPVAINAVAADLLNLKQLVNALIDDLQAYGWEQ